MPASSNGALTGDVKNIQNVYVHVCVKSSEEQEGGKVCKEEAGTRQTLTPHQLMLLDTQSYGRCRINAKTSGGATDSSGIDAAAGSDVDVTVRNSDDVDVTVRNSDDVDVTVPNSDDVDVTVPNNDSCVPDPAIEGLAYTQLMYGCLRATSSSLTRKASQRDDDSLVNDAATVPLTASTSSICSTPTSSSSSTSSHPLSSSCPRSALPLSLLHQSVLANDLHDFAVFELKTQTSVTTSTSTLTTATGDVSSGLAMFPIPSVPITSSAYMREAPVPFSLLERTYLHPELVQRAKDAGASVASDRTVVPVVGVLLSRDKLGKGLVFLRIRSISYQPQPASSSTSSAPSTTSVSASKSTASPPADNSASIICVTLCIRNLSKRAHKLCLPRLAASVLQQKTTVSSKAGIAVGEQESHQSDQGARKEEAKGTGKEAKAGDDDDDDDDELDISMFSLLHKTLRVGDHVRAVGVPYVSKMGKLSLAAVYICAVPEPVFAQRAQQEACGD